MLYGKPDEAEIKFKQANLATLQLHKEKYRYVLGRGGVFHLKEPRVFLFVTTVTFSNEL